MDYKRKLIVLKGNDTLIQLLLEKREEQRWTAGSVEADLKLLLFRDEETYFEAGNDGSFEKPDIAEVKAAAFADDEGFRYFGSAQEFEREKALLNYLNEAKMERKTEIHAVGEENTKVEMTEKDVTAPPEIPEYEEMMPFIPASLYNAVNDIVPPQECTLVPEVSVYNPFYGYFPSSDWKRIEFPLSGRYYLSGTVFKSDGSENGQNKKNALAVPCRFAPQLYGEKLYRTEAGPFYIFFDEINP